MKLFWQRYAIVLAAYIAGFMVTSPKYFWISFIMMFALGFWTSPE